MDPRSLLFHFDFLSPYAYLAWRGIHALAERHGARVEPVPVLLAAILSAHGHKGPAEIPPKRIYVIKNVARVAHSLGISIRIPPAHPFNPLLALRIASLPLADAERRALIDILFRAVWDGGPGVAEPETVSALLSGAGYDGPGIVAAAQSDMAKQALRRSTDEGLARGLFGVPTILVENELFWGVDSFPHLEAFLRGEDPVPADLVERWRTLPAQATRQ